MKRLLIVYPGAIGDVLLTRPILQLLRARIPDLTIDFAGNPSCFSLLSRDVEQCYDFSTKRFLSLFMKQRFLTRDTIAFFRRYDLTLVLLGRGIKSTEITDSVKTSLNLSVISSFPADHWNRHVTEWLLKEFREKIPALQGYSLPAVQPLPPCSERIRNTLPEPYFVVHPGSGSPKKNLELPFYLELAKCLEKHWKMHSVFVLGPAEQNLRMALEEKKDMVLSPSSLRALQAVLEKAQFYIGNDSGVSHLSAQMGIPTVALFVSTNPDVWHPLGPLWMVLHQWSGASRTRGFVRLLSWDAREAGEKITDFLGRILEREE